MGAQYLRLISISRAVNVRSLRSAILAILALAAFGSGPVWAEEDEYGSRAPFPAGPLRQIDDALRPYGIRPSLTYVGEALGNASGGIRRGAIYDGQLSLAVDADLAKLNGWSGAKFHANVLNNHGDGLSRGFLGNNLMTVSSIEALNHTRLDELWIEQSFGKNFSLRFGQLSADVEFYNSKYAGSLINSTFGWPAIGGANLPSGGPVTPLSTMGVRGVAQLSERLTLLFAVFNGNPAGPGVDDPQNLDPHGLNFRLRDSPLLMGELQYSYKIDAQRPGTFKLGAWMHTGEFSDLRFDTNGVALANPASNGIPAQHRGDFAPYAVLEQMLVPFDPKGEKGIAAFGRLQVTQADRNTVASMPMAASISADSGRRGRTTVFPSGRAMPGYPPPRAASIRIRRASARRRRFAINEAVLEATYSHQIARGWTVQPDIQYIMHPGGGASDPNSPSGQRIPDALILGVRMTVQWGARDPNSEQ